MNEDMVLSFETSDRLSEEVPVRFWDEGRPVRIVLRAVPK